jgi:cell division protein FtsI (penicillin-binding protein 3)
MGRGDYYRKLAKERTVRNFVIPTNKIFIRPMAVYYYINSNYEIRFDAVAPKPKYLKECKITFRLFSTVLGETYLAILKMN